MTATWTYGVVGSRRRLYSSLCFGALLTQACAGAVDERTEFDVERGDAGLATEALTGSTIQAECAHGNVGACGGAFTGSRNGSSCSNGAVGTCLENGNTTVGYFDSGDWVAYNSIDLTGAVGVDLRVAKGAGAGSVELRIDSSTGTLLGSYAPTLTGAWTTWRTDRVSFSATASGTHTLFVKTVGQSGVINLDWLALVAAPCTPSCTGKCGGSDGCGGTCANTCNDANACTTDTCNSDGVSCAFAAISCNDSDACTTDSCSAATGCVFTANNTCPAVIRVQAEDFSNANDSTTGNAATTDCVGTGGNLKNVDMENTTDSGGGCNVGWTTAGEWLEYPVTFASTGAHRFALRTARMSGSGTVQVSVDGVQVASINAPQTGGYQTWTTTAAVASSVNLSAGAHTLRLTLGTDNTNIGWLEITEVPGAPPPPPSGDGTGPVGARGALRVAGNRIVDAQGTAFQLRGMSLFWSQWSDYYKAANVDVLVDDWKASVVRVAVGVENAGGYLQDPAGNRAKAVAVIDRALARGLYVIIDWHDHHAQDHLVQAKGFFADMAKTYGTRPNVLYEIYNEPVDVGWPTVKAYAEQIIPVIRSAGGTGVIVVGTPNWSQDVDVAATSRITSDSNVAYTLHFYANTHKQSLRDKAQKALNAGLALLVTEWGTCDASGAGSVNTGESQTWLTFLANNAIGWANWSLHNKDEACSALIPSASTTGPWSDANLTTSGKFVKPKIP